MNGEDLFKAAVGVLFALLGGGFVWILRTVMNSREAIVIGREEHKAALVRIQHLEDTQLTMDGVRAAIELALAHRDKEHEQRRLASDKLARFELRATVTEEMEKWFRRLHQELSEENDKGVTE